MAAVSRVRARRDAIFLFDADLIGVGRLVAKARPDVWVLGDPPCPIKRSNDEVWFPDAGRRQLTIIRRDGDILIPNSLEQRAWRESRCRGFVLSVRKPDTWLELSAVVAAWQGMQNYAKERRNDAWWIGKIMRDGKVTPT